ncbi:hypothetical protein VTL71DRAFT_3252 [Oculimacula yallundae]|uniref:Heterokaryon incompatibility domain-containing protein n=1 Tax=Oculimacula yallundae TaxID=86028 RepID=A0ABR4C7T6_9HELO
MESSNMASPIPRIIALPASTPLCATCAAVFSCRPRDFPYLEDIYTTDDGETWNEKLLLESTTHCFEDGAVNGCRLCKLFMAGVITVDCVTEQMRKNRYLPEGQKYKLVFSVIAPDVGHPRLRISLLGGPGECHFRQLTCLLQLIPDVKKYHFDRESWTASSPNLELVKGWIDNCERNHAVCRVYRQKVMSDRGPSRLLSLGSESSPHLRICDKGLENVRYASLSHCWGTNMPLRLLHSSVAAMRKDIKLEDLNSTFRDAITVCRHMGLQYLWIDSLCIIQDSIEDWLSESNKMYSIYSNAVLNICGTANNPKGLLVKRNEEEVHTNRIVINWDGVCAGVFFAMLEDLWLLDVYSSPLNSRGWVLQERFLSQRNLHFGNRQLFWECQEQISCELTPDGLVDGMRPHRAWQKVLSLEYDTAERLSLFGDEAEDLIPYHIWGMIVHAFSDSTLTFGTDKLIAISALARYCQTHLSLKGEYLAGLWSSHVAYQLLWEAWPTVHGQRQRDYRAPTWSWASVDDTVYDPCTVLYADERDIVIEIKQWNIDLVSTDKYGPISGGYITIAGRLARAVVCSDREIYDRPRYDLMLALDCFIRTEGDYRKDTLFEGSTEPLVITLYQNLVVMPVRKELDIKSNSACWYGLVLRPVEGSKGTFERLGKYRAARNEEALFEQAFADFDLKAEESGLAFESKGENGIMYTVKII